MSTNGQSSKMGSCPYCRIEGVSWLEHHLTGSPPCSAAPSSLKHLLQSGKEDKVKKMDVTSNRAFHSASDNNIQPKLSATPASGSRKRVKSESWSNVIGLELRDGSVTSSDASWLDEAKKSICSFIYENRIDFDVVKSPSFRKMASLVFGPNVQIPACDKLQGWMLEYESNGVSKYVNEVKSSWAETGSSILIDGWANAESRNFINVFVDSPKGTIYLRSFDVSNFHEDLEAMKLLFEQVIEEVGSSNVVQIVTYSNSTFLKEIAKQLMDKYRSIIWTVDTWFCIDLMIQNYGAFVSETLEKAKVITRFVYNHHQVLKSVQDHAKGKELVARSKTKLALPFFTLENLAAKEQLLKEIFLSSGSEAANLTSTAEGKRVANLVADKSFWANADIVLTAVIPLVRVIELMNKKRSHMDSIYETMDQVKEAIEDGFVSKKLQYRQFWKVIDDVWCDYLYSPLHSAGYFLNPTIFYSEDVCIDKEVSVGSMHCLSRMAENLRVLDLVTDQLELYEKPRGRFKVGSAFDKRSAISTVEWWSKYGGECPELQKIAIRILSQTCSGASRFQLDRSLVENQFKGRRNQPEQQKASEKVYMRYNMQLSNIASGATNHMVSGDEIEPVWVRDWTVDKTLAGQR